MKKSILLAFAAAAALLATNAIAADGDKEITLTGEAQCAKCSLKEADKCTDAIVVEENGKKTTYLFAKNDVVKGLHKDICQAKKKMKTKGTVKEVDGKKEFTAKEFEFVK